MEMGDRNGLSELRRSLSTTPHFPATMPQLSLPFLPHVNNTAPLAPYHEPLMLNNRMAMAMPSGLLRFGHHHHGPSGSASGPCPTLFGAETGNIDGGNSRWPRQETLTLLEIRIRLDSKFKEANQKGPLWDEISRIMVEEYGYQRSGKKCREKFENLYKYYKKTKQRKAGRQDGKNYRFFRQLELLYGETTSNQRTHHLCRNSNNTMNQENHREEKPSCESLSFSYASEFETSSSSSENNGEDDDVSAVGKKVKELLESQVKKLMDSQDLLMERMLKTIEEQERERMSKEEERRRQEAALFDKEHEFWFKERAWVEARDAALMEVIKKFTGKGLQVDPRFQENTGLNWYFNPMRKN